MFKNLSIVITKVVTNKLFKNLYKKYGICFFIYKKNNF